MLVFIVSHKNKLHWYKCTFNVLLKRHIVQVGRHYPKKATRLLLERKVSYSSLKNYQRIQ